MHSHHLRPHREAVRLALAVFAAAILGLVAASASSAALNIKWYSFKDSGCTQSVDPVTTIFWYNGYQTYVQKHIPHHGVWVYDVQFEASVEPLQYFWDNGYCNGNWGSFASAYANASARYHVRFREGHYPDSSYFWFSMATPHHETSQGCGHVVDPTVNGWSGFDEGRAKLANTMAGPHYSYYQTIGNSALKTQCNGAQAGSNGVERYTRIDTLNGPT